MHNGEGATMGPWMFTADPIENGAQQLCVMSTKTHMLRIRVPMGEEHKHNALMLLLKAAEEA